MLLFNEETRRITVKPMGKELPHSYKFRRSGEVKTQVEISIASFMKFFKTAVPEKTTPFSCKWEGQLGAIVPKEEKVESVFSSPSFLRPQEKRTEVSPPAARLE